VRRRHTVKSGVPRHGISRDVPHDDAPADLCVLGVDHPLAEDVVLEASRTDEQDVATTAGVRRARDELDLTPPQVAHPRQLDNAELAVTERAAIEEYRKKASKEAK